MMNTNNELWALPHVIYFVPFFGVSRLLFPGPSSQVPDLVGISIPQEFSFIYFCNFEPLFLPNFVVMILSHRCNSPLGLGETKVEICIL